VLEAIDSVQFPIRQPSPNKNVETLRLMRMRIEKYTSVFRRESQRSLENIENNE